MILTDLSRTRYIFPDLTRPHPAVRHPIMNLALLALVLLVPGLRRIVRLCDARQADDPPRPRCQSGCRDLV